VSDYLREEDLRYSRFLVNPGQRVLDLGCGDGRLLAALAPSRGVGVDRSAEMVDRARREHPHLDFVLGDIEDPDTLDQLDAPFDVILLSDTVGSLEDVHTTLASLRPLCHADTRVVLAYYSRLWAPVLRRLSGQPAPHQQRAGSDPCSTATWAPCRACGSSRSARMSSPDPRGGNRRPHRPPPS
jgi:SAM-dependent methyltransferase